MSTDGKIEIVPLEAVMKIEIGGGMYARVYQMCMTRAEQKSEKDYQEMLEHFQKGGQPRDAYEYEMETYFSLLYEMETAAREQGQMIYKSPEELQKPPVTP